MTTTKANDIMRPEVGQRVARYFGPEGAEELIALADEVDRVTELFRPLAVRCHTARLFDVTLPDGIRDASWELTGDSTLDKALCELESAVQHALNASGLGE